MSVAPSASSAARGPRHMPPALSIGVLRRRGRAFKNFKSHGLKMAKRCKHALRRLAGKWHCSWVPPFGFVEPRRRFLSLLSGVGEPRLARRVPTQVRTMLQVWANGKRGESARSTAPDTTRPPWTPTTAPPSRPRLRVAAATRRWGSSTISAIFAASGVGVRWPRAPTSRRRDLPAVCQPTARN